MAAENNRAQVCACDTNQEVMEFFLARRMNHLRLHFQSVVVRIGCKTIGNPTEIDSSIQKSLSQYVRMLRCVINMSVNSQKMSKVHL